MRLFERRATNRMTRAWWRDVHLIYLVAALGKMRAHVYVVAGRKKCSPGRLRTVAERKKKSAKPLHGSLIEDYCMIGDCETAALVSREGSIDWLCWPTFSSAACFAALLGTRDHGFWKIAPKGKVKAVRRQYQAQTLVAETTFETIKKMERLRCAGGFHAAACGALACGADGARDSGQGGDGDGSCHSVRLWQDDSLGDEQSDRSCARLRDRTWCCCGRRLRCAGRGWSTRSEFTVRAGETVSFTLTNLSSVETLPQLQPAEEALKQTQDFWKEWNEKNQYRGPYADAVERSLMTLKAMTYQAVGWDCGGGDGFAAGEDRRHAELGLSILLAAGYGVYAADIDAGGLRG